MHLEAFVYMWPHKKLNPSRKEQKVKELRKSGGRAEQDETFYLILKWMFLVFFKLQREKWLWVRIWERLKWYFNNKKKRQLPMSRWLLLGFVCRSKICWHHFKESFFSNWEITVRRKVKWETKLTEKEIMWNETIFCLK